MSRSARGFLVFSSLVSFSAIGFAGRRSGQSETSSLEVTIRVQNYANVSRATLKRASERAADIFRHVGIETAWLDCPTGERDSGPYPACPEAFGPRDLLLKIMPEAPERHARKGEVLGIAYLSSRGAVSHSASVYPDQARELTSCKQWSLSNGGIFAAHLPPSAWEALALGVVMAHELGHLLMGVDSHSDQGIMHLHLDWRDFEEAYFGGRQFTNGQVKRLQANVGARSRAASSIASRSRSSADAPQ